MKYLWLFKPLLDFLALVEGFFYLPYLVFDLKPFILSYNPTLKPFFHAKVYGFIKDNITIDDNILVYKVIQFIAFSLFTITNEYAFDTFGIQLCPCFLWHMSKCNITSKIQMTYGRFVFAPISSSVMLEIDLSLGFNSRYML